MVAVAIGGAAVIGAGASIVGGNKAAKAQTHAADASIAEQQRQYDQTRSDFAPWRSAGNTALNALQSAYGLTPSTGQLGTAGNVPGAQGTEGSAVSPSYGGFFESPGYQFRLNEGLKAVQHSAAARGQLASGATMKAVQRYGEGLAASEYDNYTARLAQLAGVGQQATGSTAAAGSTAANNISNALTASGNARASSYTNTASSINSGLNNVMQAYLMKSSYGGGGSNSSFYTPSSQFGSTYLPGTNG